MLEPWAHNDHHQSISVADLSCFSEGAQLFCTFWSIHVPFTVGLHKHKINNFGALLKQFWCLINCCFFPQVGPWLPLVSFLDPLHLCIWFGCISRFCISPLKFIILLLCITLWFYVMVYLCILILIFSYVHSIHGSLQQITSYLLHQNDWHLVDIWSNSSFYCLLLSCVDWTSA